MADSSPIPRGTTATCGKCGEEIVFRGFSWKHSLANLERKPHVARPTLSSMSKPDDTDLFEEEKKPEPIVFKQPTYNITRRFSFDSAHRVYGHGGKCRHLHGHRYDLEVTLSGEKLSSGMLVDFGSIKTWIGEFIDNRVDHNVILWKKDPLLKILKYDRHSGKDPLVLNHNPTAENLAVFFWEAVHAILFQKEITNVSIRQIRVYETPNCWADYFGQPTPEDKNGSNLPTDEHAAPGEVGLFQHEQS